MIKKIIEIELLCKLKTFKVFEKSDFPFASGVLRSVCELVASVFIPFAGAVFGYAESVPKILIGSMESLLPRQR